jgi:hypothetical protein
VSKPRVTNRVRALRRKAGVSTAELPSIFVRDEDIGWTVTIQLGGRGCRPLPPLATCFGETGGAVS